MSDSIEKQLTQLNEIRLEIASILKEQGLNPTDFKSEAELISALEKGGSSSLEKLASIMTHTATSLYNDKITRLAHYIVRDASIQYEDIDLPNVTSLLRDSSRDYDSDRPKGFFPSKSKLRSLKMNSLPVIDPYLCAGLLKLEEIEFNSAVTFGSDSFSGCYALTKVQCDSLERPIDSSKYGFNGSYAFANTALSDISFRSLVEASKSMFYSTKIKAISQENFPKLTAISDSMFGSCKNLVSVDLPNVTSVGESSFSYCESLIDLNVPLLTQISNNAFQGCKALPKITSDNFPNVTSIGGGAFYGCEQAEEIDLPNITDVPSHGLANCYLAKRVNLPNVTRLGFEALWHLNSCTELNLPNLEECYGSSSLQGLTILESISLPKLKEPVFKLFSEARYLQNVDLPLLTYYADYMFERACDITEHSNEKITSIGKGCYQDCTSLEAVNFPKVTSIGSSAFMGCSKLVNVNILDLEQIGSGAFSSCTSLETVNFPKVTSIGSNAFYSCPITELSFPELLKIEGSLFGSSGSSLLSADFPKATELGSAFEGCSNLVNVNVPSAQKLSAFTFRECKSLTALDLPQVTFVYNYVFENCTSLESINLPLLTNVGRGTFRNCVSLTALDLPSVTNINTYNSEAFQNCIALESVSIPVSTKIGGFQNCAALKSVNAPFAKTVDEYCFKNCTSLESVSLPSVTKIDQYGFANTKLKSVDLPEVATLNHYAFAYNDNITSISLPKATYLENLIFRDCPSLESIYLPSAVTLGVQSNGSHLFINCPELKKVWIGSSCQTIPATAYSDGTYNDNFLNSPQVVIYTDLSEAPEGWGQYWNSIYHTTENNQVSSWIAAPVKWNSTITDFENNSYKAHSIVTFNVLTEGAKLVVSYLGQEYENISSLKVLPNQEVSYTLSKDNSYSELSGTFIPDSTEDHTLDLELKKLATIKEYVHPFENVETTFVDGTNFVIDEDSQSIMNGSSSYKVNSGASYGFIKWSSQSNARLLINALVSSEDNYDFGGVYIGTKEYKPTQNQVKNKTTDGSGFYMFIQSGSNSEFSEYTANLEANKEYYINFFYAKDGSGNTNQDRLKILNICFME